VGDSEAEERERQGLMRQRERDGHEREERRNAQRDLKHGRGGKNDGAERERRGRRGPKRGDGLKKREGEHDIGERPMIELRRRRVVEHGSRPTRLERFPRDPARSHQRPGIVE